ncbi:SpoIIE family protein phosphatase [Klenkia sp. LSe6-5]|uniref:SpoIIE family protein phosphatase n=1 Tax=Klenkia sesuvii TaxID=3103137 RepID=A0ABU8DSW2_9ACTN
MGVEDVGVEDVGVEDVGVEDVGVEDVVLSRHDGGMSDADPDARTGDAEVVREVFEEMPIALTAMVGPEHRFVAANAAYRALAGRGELIGKTVREVFPDLAGQQIYEVMDRAYATGQPQVGREWRHQLDRGPGGTSETLYTDFNVTARRDDAGEVIGTFAYLTEVTERVREREAAERENARIAADAHRRYRATRDVLIELQQALLPTRLPVVPGVQISASYLLADADNAAGGDWFDVVLLSGGCIALVVGDVVGHGVAASAAMGQLRVVLHERLAASGDLVAALQAVDRVATVTPGARAATVGVVVVDVQTGVLEYCTAGHPPPLVVSGLGESRYLPATGAGPLGVGSSFSTATATIDPTEGLLLYTDGILERPGRDLRASTVDLMQVTSNVTADRAFRGNGESPADRLTTQTLELLIRPTGHRDDITLLAVTPRAPVPPLHLDLPAAPQAISLARAAVNAWQAGLHASDEDQVAIDHAVVELVTNAYEHAPADAGEHSRTTISVDAELDDGGHLRVRVADDGCWRDPVHDHDGSPGNRGYGLAMTAALVDDLHIDRGATGTTVTVRRRASHAAILLTADQIAFGRHTPAHRPEHTTFTAHPGRLAVDGPLDASNVEEFGSELDRLSLAGTRELTVDLAGVTHLASAVVAELHRVAPTDGGYPLRLHAPVGSTAHQILSLVGLPHTTDDPHAVPGGPG